jgi:antitoxin (DNA-binding transcriptional repressor) of toxin-antitoxin stability system
MKTITVGEFKSNLAQIIEKILKGEEYVVSYGRKRKKIFKVVPYQEEKPKKRKLGLLEGKITIKFHDDWEMSDEEFLNS